MQKLYKYGFIGLGVLVVGVAGLAVVAVQSVPAVQFVPGMNAYDAAYAAASHEERLKVDEMLALVREIKQFEIELDLSMRRRNAILEKTSGLTGDAALEYLPVLRRIQAEYEDDMIRWEALQARGEVLKAELAAFAE